VRALIVVLASLLATAADEFDSLYADRAAVEKVYHEHRMANSLPFEQALPLLSVQRLVNLDLKKEALLKRRYGVEISPEQVEREVRRIDSTTRAPEVLRDLRKAVGDSPARFARTVARPLVVERELRARFENDDNLHAPQREEAESIRREVLSAKKQSAGIESLMGLLKHTQLGSVQETTWHMESPAMTLASSESALSSAAHSSVSATGGVYAIDARAQVASVSSPTKRAEQPRFSFEDLPTELRTILHSQLRKAGDVSAVIENPRDFRVFLAERRTAKALTAAVLTIPKRGYDQWLAEQP